MADINNFISTYLPAAQLAAAQLGTDPAHVLGQWGLESGWGKSVIPGTNNIGNIKSTNGRGVVAVDNQLGTSSTYAAYDSPHAAADAYANLLQHARYQGVQGSTGNPTAFISGLVNGGYAEDQNYGGKLNSAIQAVQKSGAVPNLADMKMQLAQQVTEDYAKGTDPAAIVQGLMSTKLAGADVMGALKKGIKPDQILSVVGGAPLAQFKSTDPGERVKAQGFFTNVGQGISNAAGDLANGTRQLGDRVIGDDAALKANQAAQVKAEADPSRRALESTVGGKIGSVGTKALPYIAAGIIAPEGLLPALAMNGAAGAASGALTPTTGDGQILHNIGVEGALGAVGGGAGYAVGKGISAVASKALGGDAAATARMAEANAQGLPVNAASVSGPNGFWRNIAESMPENRSVVGAQANADKAIASKVGEGIGLKNYEGAIDTNMLNSARPAIKQALDDATNVQVMLPHSMKADLQALVKKGANPLTEGIANNSTVKTAISNLTQAIESGVPVAGRDLQGLASELKGLLYTPGASHGEKQLASEVIEKINGSLTSNMTSEQSAAFSTANSQYRNLLAVQKMVKASNDTGVVTPRQMLQAAKTGSFSNSFLKGEAPFQNLAGTASDLYGPSAGKGLGAVIGKAMGSPGNHSLAAAAVLEPHTGIPLYLAKQAAGALLGRVASSQNPTLIRLTTGAGGKAMDPALVNAISKALGAGSAAGAGSLSF